MCYEYHSSQHRVVTTLSFWFSLAGTATAKESRLLFSSFLHESFFQFQLPIHVITPYGKISKTIYFDPRKLVRMYTREFYLQGELLQWAKVSRPIRYANYTYTCIHTDRRTYTHIQMHSYISTVHAYIHTYIHTHTYMHI